MSQPVTLVCPTYGRFELLEEALGSALWQTYNNLKVDIHNDGPDRIRLLKDSAIENEDYFLSYSDNRGIKIYNWKERFKNLGVKRDRMIEMATTKLVANLDDDDLILPHHIEDAVRYIEGWGAYRKPRVYLLRERDKVTTLKKGASDGQLMFFKNAYNQAGGYPHKQNYQGYSLLKSFSSRNLLNVQDDGPWETTYCVRKIKDDIPHSSNEDFDKNKDFADGRRLIPSRPDWLFEGIHQAARDDILGNVSDVDSFLEKFRNEI